MVPIGPRGTPYIRTVNCVVKLQKVVFALSMLNWNKPLSTNTKLFYLFKLPVGEL